ncbi:MAG TPA: cold shock domain-containing protein [Thermohalobaculum sp.]|nr:cold shock domain-containing protein [Thermohalobaculum sp.]
MSETHSGWAKSVWGRVKWYDAVKGYGFVVPENGGPDIMVHASCVRASGRMALAEGARVHVVCGHGQRGLAAQELLEVEEPDESAASSGVPGAPGFAEPARPTEFLAAAADLGPLEPARVKWFDKQKGFGFVNVFGREEDVFVHMETVRRSGFQDLAGGEAMAVRTTRGPRGLMVAELRLWEAAAEKDDTSGPGEPGGPGGPDTP